MRIPDCWNYWEQEELCLQDLDEPIDSSAFLERLTELSKTRAALSTMRRCLLIFANGPRPEVGPRFQAAALTFGKDPEKLKAKEFKDWGQYECR